MRQIAFAIWGVFFLLSLGYCEWNLRDLRDLQDLQELESLQKPWQLHLSRRSPLNGKKLERRTLGVPRSS